MRLCQAASASIPSPSVSPKRREGWRSFLRIAQELAMAAESASPSWRPQHITVWNSVILAEISNVSLHSLLCPCFFIFIRLLSGEW